MDELNILAYYDNMFVFDEEAELNDRITWFVFIFIMLVYMVLETIYLYRAYDIKASQLNTAKHRFGIEARSMMLSFSLVTVMMVAFPFANRTLHFVSHNGMVNLYMYVTCYFFEGIEKDIK